MGNKKSVPQATIAHESNKENEYIEDLEMTRGLEVEQETKQPESLPMSFFDLPDHILLEIFKLADLGPLGLKLRLDKITEMKIHSLIRAIKLEIGQGNYWLTLNSWRTMFNKKDLVEALNRWSDSMNPRSIEIVEYVRHDENIGSAMLFLCQFNTDQLTIKNENEDATCTFTNKEWNEKYKKFKALPALFSELDFSTLLVMAANIKEVSIDLTCSSIGGMDLCIFWKSLVEGDSKLESFSVVVREGVERDFLKAAFNVVIEDDLSEYNTVRYTKATASMQPIKIYSRDPGEKTFSLNQIIFNGNLMTDIDDERISFRKITDGEKSEMMEELFEIKMDQVYKFF